MSDRTWPLLGDVILVQDLPTTEAQRELWENQQPPTRKGEVVEVPREDGSGFLVIDVGGEYGGVNYAARDFGSRYTWKLAKPRPSEADALVKSIRQQAQQSRIQGSTQKEADDLLWEMRDIVRRNEGARINPRFRNFLDKFTELDRSLTAGSEHPSDWQ